MDESNCDNRSEHCDFHACQLRERPHHPDIDKIFRTPRYVCTNCGAKVHDARNVCHPEKL